MIVAAVGVSEPDAYLVPSFSRLAFVLLLEF
jgi:hypothetical protein